MLFAACAIAVLCLVSVSRSDPLPCEEVVQHFDQLDLHHLEGKWALVAGSVKNIAVEDILKGRDSVTIDVHNSTYIRAIHIGGVCQYHTRNISLEGHIFTTKVGDFNFTGTFFQTSCQDCLVVTIEVQSPNYESQDFYLLSKRRAVNEKELEEFRAQVACLNMPSPVVMDPTKELCPDQTASEPDAQPEEKAEGEQA